MSTPNLKKRKSDSDNSRPPQPISYIPKHSDSDSDSDEGEEEEISSLLQPLTKDQLISLLRSAAASSSQTLAEIRRVADIDPSHRKLFVHGLGWDTTADSLRHAFSPFGPIDDVRIVTDKSTGKSKGYGFVLFRHRKSARKALKQPQKLIDSRMTACQLSSVGSAATPNPSTNNPNLVDNSARKVFVGNVQPDMDVGRLKAFFARFGEIEEGPIGLDRVTGKPRGFAMFVYRSLDGLRKALEEPNKNFEGHLLVCRRAMDNSNREQPRCGGAMGPANPNPAPDMNPIPNHNSNSIPNPNPNAVPLNVGPAYPAMPDMTALLTQGLLQQNPGILAMLAAAGQNVAANPMALGLLNPAFAAALGGGAHAVAPTSGAVQPTVPVANTGFGGFGSVGYQQNVGGFQGPPGFQNSQQAGAPQGGSYQGAVMGQGAAIQRPPVGQMGGFGPH